MNKIFRYECRRLLGSKVFWALLAITAAMAWSLLTNEIIWGIANTAPFSPWSFGYYLARMLPFMCTVALLFISRFSARHARAAQVLIDATSIKPAALVRARLGAALLGIGLIALLVTGMGLGFLVGTFGDIACGALILPTLLTLLPTLVFTLGMGWALGSRQPVWVYVLMAILFAAPWLPLPYWLNPSPALFMATYPIELGILDPAFSVPPSLWLGRALLLVIGLAPFLPRMKRREAARI